ncbi:MAG: MFS transporter [Oscillospiraceae bacterium]|jgi:Na+/melibiose symporter-like transporter|nr:MFS transporter [Oscillospiraceae bacterium]
MALSESQRAAIRHPIQWFLNPEPHEEGAIPRRELSFLSLGIMGQNELYNMPGTNWFFHFCTDVLKIDEKKVGFMTGAVTLFDALNDPIAGAIIDRHRFKDGRKLTPWIRYTMPFIAVLAFLLFVNWGFASETSRIVYCVGIYLLWDGLYSFQDASQWGLVAMISPKSSERARATQWADIGAFLGGLIPGLLLPMLGGGGAFGLSRQTIYIVFAAFLCLGGGFQGLFATKVTERIDAPVSEASFFKRIGILRHNYILILFLVSELLNSVAPNIQDIYMFQQMQYTVFGKVWQAATLVTIFTAVTGLPGSAAKFFTTKIADRVGGMKNIMIIGRVADIACNLLAFAIGINTFPRFVLVYLLKIFSFLPNGMYGIAMRSMITDSVDYVEWKTGERTEGITMSMRNLMSKATGALSRTMQGLSLSFLDYNAHLVDAGIPQGAKFQQWSYPIYKLGPTLGLLLSLLPLLALKYPDSLKAQVESDLAERRGARRSAEESVILSPEETMAQHEANLALKREEWK